MNNIIAHSPLLSPLQSPSDQEGVLKEYVLSPESKLRIVFDSIKGAKGILYEKNQEYEIPFKDFKGIVPRRCQFNQSMLKQLLENTYIKLQPSCNGHFSVVINYQLKGGGNGHSSHCSHSTHAQSPPPPRNVAINYNAGFPIQMINRTNTGTGQFINQTGGIGQTTYSITFQTHDPAAVPTVTVMVWKKDYFANEIGRLQLNKKATLQALEEEKAKKRTLESSKRATFHALAIAQNNKASLQTNIAAQKQHQDEWDANENKLKISENACSAVINQIRTEGPNIRTLIELLALTDKLGIKILTNIPEALTRFRSRDTTCDQYIGNIVSNNSLLGAALTSLNSILAESHKAKNKNIVALIGNTGTGKSTAVNHLLGIPMKYVSEKGGGYITVADHEQEIAKIGHHKACSETLHAHVYERSNAPFTFADCGGFFDTRGVTSDLAVTTSLKLTLEKAHSVKLIICFDSSIIMTDRGIHFYQSISLALKSLLKNYQAHQNSILIMFTKPTMGLDGVLFNGKEAKGLLTEMMDDLAEGSEQKDLYRFLLRNDGQYICVYNPLSNQSRDEVHALLNKMTPIKNTKEAFQVACSADSQVAFFEKMTKTAAKVNEMYASYAMLHKQVLNYRGQRVAIDSKIAALEKQNKSLSESIQNNEAFINANSANLEEQLKNINKKIVSLRQAIAVNDATINSNNTTEYISFRNTGAGFSRI